MWFRYVLHPELYLACHTGTFKIKPDICTAVSLPETGVSDHVHGQNLTTSSMRTSSEITRMA